MKYVKNVNLYGQICDVGIENGKFSFIGKASADGEDAAGAKIYPGLIDTHSHGCLGMDVMDGDLHEMARYYLSRGTTTWYPTTATVASADIIAACGRDTDFPDGATVAGFHMEGPFINPRLKGAQNAQHAISPTLELVRAAGRVERITVAPELPGALELIEKCPARVSIGHTECTYEIATEAFARGARSLTHTFNCMPPIHHRAPGPIPAGAECGAYAELICDGVHVHPSAVRALVSLYGEDRVVLVSDSTRLTGLEDGDYEVDGVEILLRDGVARTRDGNLAGSSKMLFDCVKCAIGMGIPERTAVKMASENPARMMGLNKGRIELGYDADFILVDCEFNLLRAVARGIF